MECNCFRLQCEQYAIYRVDFCDCRQNTKVLAIKTSSWPKRSLYITLFYFTTRVRWPLKAWMTDKLPNQRNHLEKCQFWHVWQWEMPVGNRDVNCTTHGSAEVSVRRESSRCWGIVMATITQRRRRRRRQLVALCSGPGDVAQPVMDWFQWTSQFMRLPYQSVMQSLDDIGHKTPYLLAGLVDLYSYISYSQRALMKKLDISLLSCNTGYCPHRYSVSLILDAWLQTHIDLLRSMQSLLSVLSLFPY